MKPSFITRQPLFEGSRNKARNLLQSARSLVFSAWSQARRVGRREAVLAGFVDIVYLWLLEGCEMGGKSIFVRLSC